MHSSKKLSADVSLEGWMSQVASSVTVVYASLVYAPSPNPYPSVFTQSVIKLKTQEAYQNVLTSSLIQEIIQSELKNRNNIDIQTKSINKQL